MKATNLISLISAKQKLSPLGFNKYLEYFGINIKEHEILGITSMAQQICGEKISLLEIDILDGFYVGFKINQISKEFDLLRIGEQSIINIELKQENKGELMKEQLLQNRYYLSFLEKTVHSFTYVRDEEKLYHLNIEHGVLAEIPISELRKILREQELVEVDDIQKLFDPSNYLVSPFNSTDRFISGQYFLTDHQSRIKSEIINLSPTAGPTFISVEGAAGTGKSLLTYDLAKEYMNQGRSVQLFHVGGLNSGHQTLNKNGWSIAPIKDYKDYDLDEYDVIIFDEVQRIYKQQLEEILNILNQSEAIVVFSYDGEQCLAEWEITRNIPKYIQELKPHIHYKLTSKIRTNKEIASFIKNLFDLSKRSPLQTYSNISLQFFNSPTSAKNYTRILADQGWKIINYTPSRYDPLPTDSYSDPQYETAHNVIGQEYDRVAVILDQYFYYEEGKLSTRGYKPYYHPTKMLFQMITRTRKKLHLVIIQNELLLQTCINILQEKK